MMLLIQRPKMLPWPKSSLKVGMRIEASMLLLDRFRTSSISLPKVFSAMFRFRPWSTGTAFLVEDHDVWINHSLMERENLYRNQHNSNTADVYLNHTIVLVGDADYTGTNYPPLLGTRQELGQVEQLIDDGKRPANGDGAGA
jgi:hypothetical protein